MIVVVFPVTPVGVDGLVRATVSVFVREVVQTVTATPTQAPGSSKSAVVFRTLSKSKWVPPLVAS